MLLLLNILEIGSLLLEWSFDLELSYVLIFPMAGIFILGIEMLINHFIAIIGLFSDSSRNPIIEF